MKNITLFFLLFVVALSGQYQFTSLVDIPCTEVKSQDRTGTCWSFATTSFIESELMRLGGEKTDLSEMFIVRNIYRTKARNYILRQGKANFSQGSLAHDMINAFQEYGIVPESHYSGKKTDGRYDHSEMEAGLKGFLDGVLAAKKPSKNWSAAFEAILDVYLGPVMPLKGADGSVINPVDYAKSLGLESQKYVGITSFSHHPYGSEFILEIPDNFSNGAYLNLPLNDLVEITKNALRKGYTVSWDGDVSEKTFSAQQGLAVLPAEATDDPFASPIVELEVTAELRQEAFENWTTTDDHLMHIVGMATDQNGRVYFKVKNSWGEISPHKGFLYMSEAYFLMKTVSIYLNASAVDGSYLTSAR